MTSKVDTRRLGRQERGADQSDDRRGPGDRSSPSPAQQRNLRTLPALASSIVILITIVNSKKWWHNVARDENLRIVFRPFDRVRYLTGARSEKPFQVDDKLTVTKTARLANIVVFQKEGEPGEYVFEAREFDRRAKKPDRSSRPQ
jgi:hypothetical protein